MTDTQPGTEIDTKEFRNALGGFATGVTIVTTLAEDSAGDLRPAAVTANSFASVSLDPPLILWSIARSAQSFQAFEKAEFFAVHILHSAQIGLSNLCATKNADKFGEISWRPGLN
ncbi:MAG: flavin reductase family protein, partial [Pseudomonadales bacterium]|nr:flavin reductase family protein [Pseudomonadales bacterium]